ncbi:hypothetical protein SAMN05444365_11820 [Micromonospora pattaloongensis]|uniref:Uncharacterized protein n=1 Tax=Micromonospora pattaloongensis TaxID=405436 RepID=A0A1H3T669_9ACTN|nr:hypothetical protein SAMN05444365_11820 [Micromonospora pattaloongensis]
MTGPVPAFAPLRPGYEAGSKRGESTRMAQESGLTTDDSGMAPGTTGEGERER